MDEDIVRESAAELSALRAHTHMYVAKRLVTWAVRWIIGFAIIGAVTYFYDGLAWLWWAGIGLAGTSLVLMFVMHWLMSNKLASVEGELNKLDEMIRDSGER